MAAQDEQPIVIALLNCPDFAERIDGKRIQRRRKRLRIAGVLTSRKLCSALFLVRVADRLRSRIDYQLLPLIGAGDIGVTQGMIWSIAVFTVELLKFIPT